VQNLKKHSGTKRAQLSVRHISDRLFLSLCDEGMGLDKNRMEKPGLGILSMQGRARLLGGEFEIHSKPGKGTRIDAWVPLQPVADPVRPIKARAIDPATIEEIRRKSRLSPE